MLMNDARSNWKSSGRALYAMPGCVLMLLLGACSHTGVLDPKGPVSQAERLILLNSTVIMLVVVVPVIVLTLGFAWWYRSSNKRAAYDPEWTYSGAVELVVWSIPTMVVILLAGVTWIGAHQLDPIQRVGSKGAPLHIQVVSLDWKWLFIYPEQGIATVNQLMVPAGASLDFALTSATVMNSFFIPQLGSQIYTMPGMTTHLNLLADDPGEFEGISSHYSGDGFSGMHFTVHAMSQADFERWAATTRAAGNDLDAHAYADLAKPSSDVAPSAFRRVDPALFRSIVNDAASMANATAKDH
jgi:cytochrome o ubiquinol oxidase subunit 2